MTRQSLLLAALALAGFVTALDNSVVNVALPTMQQDLNASVPALEWIVSSYVLSFASLLIFGGRLADLFGRRRILLIGLSALIVTSVLAGFAPSAELLIAARLAQGAAAALVLPSSLAVLAADVDRAKRDLAAGVWTCSLAVALALGPMVGGVLAEQWHWSWIFFLHLPFGLLTIALVCLGLPATQAEPETARDLDIGGLLLATLILTAVSFALVEGQSVGFGHPMILSALLIAALAVPGLLQVERSATNPMLHLDLFRNKVFTGGTIAQVLWGLGINGTLLYTSLFIQDVLNFSPSTAGMVFVPLAVALILCVPFVPSLTNQFGPRGTVTLGMVLVAAGLALLSFTHAGSTFTDLLPAVLTLGVGSALITPLTSTVLSSVAPEGAGVASAMIGAAREASGVLGVAMIGVVISVSSGGADFLDGYAAGLWVAAGIVLLGGITTAYCLPTHSISETTQEAEADIPADANPTRQ